MKKVLLLIAFMIGYADRTVTALPIERSQTVVYIDGEKFYVHTVRSGETLYAIARCYQVSEQTLLRYNPGAADGLKADQTIRIPMRTEEERPLTAKEEKKLKKTFIRHTVASGETLYAIARRYEISVDTILEDNANVDPRHLSVGQTLLIRKKGIGRTGEEQTQAELEQYAERLNRHASAPETGYDYYVVQPKETVYSLSRRYGMSEQEFIELNELQNGLKAGAIIRVPNGKSAEPAAVEPADTLKFETVDTLPAAPAVKEVNFRSLRPAETLRIAMLLPLTSKGAVNTNFSAFYQGFLLGLEEVKSRGYSVDLHLYDTQRSRDKVEAILEEPAFREARLIVGPVYEEDLEPVLRYAEERELPVVTPLADLKKVDSDALFQMAPNETHKYDKLQPLLKEGAPITLIRTSRTDKEFEAEIRKQLEGYSFEYYDYQSVQGADFASRSDLTPLLKRHDKHLFIVLADNEVEVDRILASLASAQTNLQARSQSAPDYCVIGNARWNRYTNIDRTTFFKNRVVLFSIFHAKRDAEIVRQFDARYIRAFGAMPNLYSYRGYETAVIFCPGMYSDIEYDMEGRRYKPLQTTYHFRQEPSSRTHVNQEWVRVNYNSDFTITLE